MSEGATFTYDQLDAWAKIADEGKRVLASAQAVEQQARDNEERKLLRPAAEQYDQALQEYNSAIKHLEQLIGITFEHVAIAQMVREASSSLATAQARRDQLVREEPAMRCRDKVLDAQKLQQEADQYLRSGEPNEARERAIKARDLDLTLSEWADSILRGSESSITSSNLPVGPIIIGVIIVVLIALAVIFGPGLWSWVSEFLFPAVIIIRG
ncbi:MAG: hypothetical protein WCI67_00065 [Chloroflexales bacterium]